MADLRKEELGVILGEAPRFRLQALGPGQNLRLLFQPV